MTDPIDVPLGPSTLAKKWRLEVQTTVQVATLSATLSTGSPITTIAINAATAAMAAGPFTLTSGANTQTFTATSPVTVGATSIAVSSVTPNFAYPSTTPVNTLAYIKVRGIKNFVSPVATTLQDDSDYDSGGWGSQTATKLAWTATATLARKTSLIGGFWSSGAPKASYDAGQEALRSVAGTLGDSNTIALRWCEMDPSVRAEAYTGNATVDWTEVGGAMDALDDVTVVLTGQGARTSITHPYPLS